MFIEILIVFYLRSEKNFMKWLDLPQTNREELLDLHHGSLREVRRSLHDIQRINTYLGGAKIVCDATFAMLRKHELKRATVLDIGTGDAAIPQGLIRRAKRYDIELRAIALDISARHLQIALEDVDKNRQQKVVLVQADAFRLPFADNSIDIVISTLFFHHFRPTQIHQLLLEFERVSSRGFIVNDLVRHRLPLWFFCLTRPIFARSYITRHDGEASIRRGYTTTEMSEIVSQSAVPHATVREHFPFRMSIVREKSDSTKQEQ